MTFQPPPPPPPGSPPPGAQPARPGFDPKSVNPLDWAIMAAGLLAFIFSFVSYYSASAGPITVTWNAWHGFFGWFAMLCALIGSVVVAISLFAPQIRMNAPPRTIGLVLYAVATVCVIIAIFVVPIDTGGFSGIDKGHGFGFWISLIVIIVGLLVSLMRFQQSGGQLPGALGNIPNIGDKAPGGAGRSGGPGTPPPPPGPPAGQ